MKSMKKTAAFILAVAMLLMLCACGGETNSAANTNAAPTTETADGQTYSWKLSHGESANGWADLWSNDFANRLNEISGGTITVEIFPGGQLGEGADQVELASGGACEFVYTDVNSMTATIPLVGLLNLHYLQPADREVATEVLAEGSFIDYLAPYYANNNLTCLAYQPQSYNDWTSNIPISTPDDFKKIKMRTMSSAMQQMAYEAYGATTVVIPYSELYSALQLGMVDAQANSFYSCNLMKFYEVSKYGIRAYQEVYTGVFLANGDFMNSLPEEVQSWIHQAVAETADAFNAVVQERDKEGIDGCLAGGLEISYFDEDQIAAFAAVAAPTYQTFINQYGEEAQELYDVYCAAKAKFE